MTPQKDLHSSSFGTNKSDPEIHKQRPTKQAKQIFAHTKMGHASELVYIFDVDYTNFLSAAQKPRR